MPMLALKETQSQKGWYIHTELLMLRNPSGSRQERRTRKVRTAPQSGMDERQAPDLPFQTFLLSAVAATSRTKENVNFVISFP
jgi:hypothetical protein